LYFVIQFEHGEIFERAEFDNYDEAWDWFVLLRMCYRRFSLRTDWCLLADEEGTLLHTLGRNGELD
jgi:hypothetical protein